MSFEVCFTDPFLDSVAEPNPQTPQFMDVTIAGRAYVLDTSFEPYRRDAFRHRSIQSQRESISLDNIPGEGTVNTEGLWRRQALDWSKGAGQPYQDRKDSIDGRFSTSKGVNPWMQWQVSLLNATAQIRTLTDGGQILAVGGYLVLLDESFADATANAVLVYNQQTGVWSPVFTSGQGITSIATDGFNIWAATGDGIWTADASTAVGTWTQYVTTGPVEKVYYVADRLMATVGPNVYNIIATGALPTALWTHPNAAFVFTCMADGSSQIYIGGYAGGGIFPTQSSVYRTTIEATGTALTIPVVALPMEGGEYATSLYGYLNYVFVGSNLGIRMCRTIAAYDPTGNEGDLEAGPLVPGLFPPGPLNSPCLAMTGNNRFVYFGWNNYDSESTGIGRCDLSTFIDTQSPAFASDLMVTGQGWITSMDWNPATNSPVFCVAGMGVYVASTAFCDSGYVTSGYIGYGIADNKIALAGDIGTIQPQSGTASMALASDSSANIFAFVGQQNSSSSGGSPNQGVFPINATRGEQYTVQITLTRDPVTGQSPTMHRWMLKAIPAITAGTTVSVVIRMWNVEDIAGQDYYFDPYVEKAFLENLRTTQTVFAYSEGPLTYPYCTIDEIDWLPEKRQDALAEGGYEGNIIVYIKTYDLGA